MAKLGRMKKTMVTLQTVFTGLGLAGG